MRATMRRWKSSLQEPEPRMTLDQLKASQADEEARRLHWPRWLHGLLLLAYAGVVVERGGRSGGWAPAIVAGSTFAVVTRLVDWGFERRARRREPTGS